MIEGHFHPRTRSRFSALWDKLGIVASGLCLVDCVVLPLASALLVGFGSSFSWAREMHWVLLPLIATTASLAFYHSYRAHRSYRIVAVGATGFILLAVGEIFESELRITGLNWVSIAGSALLIGAHLTNLRMHWHNYCGCAHEPGVHGRMLFGMGVGGVGGINSLTQGKARGQRVIHPQNKTVIQVQSAHVP